MDMTFTVSIGTDEITVTKGRERTPSFWVQSSGREAVAEAYRTVAYLALEQAHKAEQAHDFSVPVFSSEQAVEQSRRMMKENFSMCKERKTA